MELLLPRNMRGAKWFNEATYFSDDDRRKVIRAVETAKQCCDASDKRYGPRTVGVRVPSYIGEPHPIASITYGPGGSRLHGCVYR
jgi:hypothetical protein